MKRSNTALLNGHKPPVVEPELDTVATPVESELQTGERVEKEEKEQQTPAKKAPGKGPKA